MPSVIERNSKGMSCLVRREPLSKEDWVNLLESRRLQILPFLSKISLQTLGTFRCVPSRKVEGGRTALGADRPANQSSLKNPLAFQGLFYESVWWKKSGVEAETTVYGLRRDGKWLFIKVKLYTADPEQQKATDLYVEELSTADMLNRQVVPKVLWQKMGRAILQIVEKRRLLYEQLRPLEVEILNEESAFQLIPVPKQE
jgi:hypothetical protein